jgi:hypothetical protein
MVGPFRPVDLKGRILAQVRSRRLLFRRCLSPGCVRTRNDEASLAPGASSQKHANQDFDAARVDSCGQPGIYGVRNRKNLWSSFEAGRVT